MRKRIIAIITALLLTSLLTLPALAFEPGEATVKADWLNFRDAPGMEGGVIGLAPEGTVVEILADLGDWCLVRWNGVEGYMSARYLVQSLPEVPAEPEAPAPSEEPAPAAEEPAPPVEEPAPEPAEEAEDSSRIGVLTGDAVRFRAGPGLDEDVYGYFYIGNRVTVLEQTGDWYKVESGGRIGYVYAKYVHILEKSDPAKAGEPVEASELMAAIIATAEDNLGIRYCYGGTSPSTGFDCSGFVYYCFSQNGISLERTASGQYTMGAYVDKSELIPGDLVFFVSPGTWSIGHVGIYIGDGSFIHASSGQAKIMVSGLSESYWSSYYYGARRIEG